MGKVEGASFVGRAILLQLPLAIWEGTSAICHAGYDKTGDGVTNPAPQPITVVKKPQSQAKPPQVDLDHLNWLLIKWLILASLPPSSWRKSGLQTPLNSSIHQFNSGRVISSMEYSVKFSGACEKM